MASVLDVAKYILKEIGGTTAMKLQKLVYYCQAWSLAWDDVPLFWEDFEAWAHGPVCPDLFEKHKGRFSVDASLLSDIPDFDFSDSQKETIQTVLDYYAQKEPHWLSELTHKEAPWKNARSGIAAGEPSHVVITKESMQQYYGGLQ
ncbi:MAG: SocA family protein [Eubacterium sp.]|nr:SocA family protein [Eubacterium sp.]